MPSIDPSRIVACMDERNYTPSRVRTLVGDALSAGLGGVAIPASYRDEARDMISFLRGPKGSMFGADTSFLVLCASGGPYGDVQISDFFAALPQSPLNLWGARYADVLTLPIGYLHDVEDIRSLVNQIVRARDICPAGAAVHEQWFALHEDLVPTDLVIELLVELADAQDGCTDVLASGLVTRPMFSGASVADAAQTVRVAHTMEQTGLDKTMALAIASWAPSGSGIQGLLTAVSGLSEGEQLLITPHWAQLVHEQQ